MAYDLTDQEIAGLERVQSADEWNRTVDGIKQARGGAYPDDWWEKMKLSGRMDRIFARWGGSAEIRLTRGSDALTMEAKDGATGDRAGPDALLDRPDDDAGI